MNLIGMNSMDVIDFKIYGDDMQFVEVELDPMEAAVAEAGAMMYMEEDIVMNTTLDPNSAGGGLFGKLRAGRRRRPLLKPHASVEPPDVHVSGVQLLIYQARKCVGGPDYLQRFATEQTFSVNAAAVGGDASLISMNLDILVIATKPQAADDGQVTGVARSFFSHARNACSGG